MPRLNIRGRQENKRKPEVSSRSATPLYCVAITTPHEPHSYSINGKFGRKYLRTGPGVVAQCGSSSPSFHVVSYGYILMWGTIFFGLPGSWAGLERIQHKRCKGIEIPLYDYNSTIRESNNKIPRKKRTIHFTLRWGTARIITHNSTFPKPT